MARTRLRRLQWLRRALLAALAVLAAGGLAGPAAEPAASGEDAGLKAKIAGLVRQLGDDDWRTREQASAELRAVGAAALAALQEASGSADAEVRFRAGELIRRIERARAFSAMGNTLVVDCEDANGRVLEVDKDGQEVWALALPGWPTSAQRLADGKTLLTFLNGSGVRIVDRDGKVVWELPDLKGAFYAERLENGHVLVGATANCPDGDGQVQEIDEDRKVLWEVKVKAPRSCRRLPNGNTLICHDSPGEAIEVDKEGKTVWKVPAPGTPFSAERLPNGHTLVAEHSPARVREFDKDGKEVWSFAGQHLGAPCDAHRLANGHTLIADRGTKRVLEVDQDGAVVWERAEIPNIYRAVRLEPRPEKKKE